MMVKDALVRLFEAGDGRDASAEVLYINRHEKVTLVSQGWCTKDSEDECNDISVYRFLHHPDDMKCEKALIYKWTKDVCIDSITSVEVPVVRLTINNKHDVIDEPGQYILFRGCDTYHINVYGKFEPKT